MSYSEYIEWKGWDESKFGSYGAYDDSIYNAEIGYCTSRLGGSSLRIVEIGFGNGSLLAWCRNRGMEVFGLEVQEELQARARQAGFSTVDTLAELPSGTVDIVAAFDVFEHVPYASLKEMCGEIRRVLKPGGYLIARFPNGDSPFSAPYQNGDATHVHAIGALMIEGIMASTGFSIEALRGPAEVPLSLKSRISLPIKRAMRWLFRSYVRYAFQGKHTPSTFAMNYVLIARKG